MSHAGGRKVELYLRLVRESPKVCYSTSKVTEDGGGGEPLKFLPFLTQLAETIFIILFLGLVTPEVHLNLQNLLQGGLWSCLPFYCTQLLSLSGFAAYSCGPAGKQSKAFLGSADP